MADDELEAHERSEARERGLRPHWLATALGGPLDGAEIKIDIVPGLDLRALHLTIAVGPNDGTNTKPYAWHYYVYGQGYDSAHKTHTEFFQHMGVLDGNPKVPPNAP